jgi:hypothetical protein
MRTVYVESSILGYLRQRPHGNAVTTAQQVLPEIPAIARAIMARAILPPKAEVDALHLATAAHHEIDYVLTWNCSHIANARILPAIRGLLTKLGVAMPFVCTPEEFVGNDANP